MSYLDLPRSHRPPLIAPPLRVLGVISSPADYGSFDAERECENLEQALAGSAEAGQPVGLLQLADDLPRCATSPRHVLAPLTHSHGVVEALTWVGPISVVRVIVPERSRVLRPPVARGEKRAGRREGSTSSPTSFDS